MNNIDEFVCHFHSLNLKYAEKVKGFDPSGIFVEHLLVVGFNNSFIKIIMNGDGDNASSTLSHDTSNLETILNTNESYKQRGKVSGEKSAISPNVTLKSRQSRSSDPTAYPSKKVTLGSSGGGGDKNPPSGKIESSHKLPLSVNSQSQTVFSVELCKGFPKLVVTCMLN
jgi:hypothetical protein